MASSIRDSKNLLFRASVTTGLLCFACILLFLLTPWPLPTELRDYARMGMLLVTFSVPIICYAGYREWRRPVAPIIPEEVEVLSLDDLELAGDATLTMLEDTTRRIALLDSVPRGEVDAIGVVQELLATGFSLNASDIHMTPEKDLLRFTYRIDGVLYDVGGVSSVHLPFIVNRVKVLARLSIHVHAKPQDGRFTLDRDAYQARVSTLPTNHGEKVVIRLAVNDHSRYSLDRIGFRDETLVLYKTMLGREHGLIYLTGPTGSGKTTTLYASLLHVRQTQANTLNLVTLEDPMEVDFRGISQTQVNAAVGLTFADGLRSILRQDPDVIMLGEIRDEETATTAIRAGLTGHLILTTVHADSCVGVFQRLLQLNVDRFQYVGASIAVVNQRLAIRNCPHCTVKVPLTPLQERQLHTLGIEVEGPFFEGSGCQACRGKGRLGRTPLIEVLKVDDTIRDALLSDMPKHELEALAVREGMVTLNQQAMDQARGGVLPIHEVIRVLAI